MVEESEKSEREDIMSKQIDKIVKLIVSHKSRGGEKIFWQYWETLATHIISRDFAKKKF